MDLSKNGAKPLTNNLQTGTAVIKLMDAAAAIFNEMPDSKDAAFIARQLVQASLPHSNPGNVPVWIRKNGNMALILQQGYDSTGQPFGYPYGTIPRLLLFWITAEASRNKADLTNTNPRRLELGNSLSGFMAELGLNSANGGTGAKRSDARRVKDQMQKLFRCHISFETQPETEARRGIAWRGRDITTSGELWWDAKQPKQPVLWGSWIELGEEFYKSITAAPVPVDVRALRALTRSPLALDLYAWLVYEAFRAHKGNKPRFETWAQLHAHLGGDYARIDNFRAKTKAAIAKILAVYPGLKLGKRMGGIQVLPESLPALQPRRSAFTASANPCDFA